MSWTCKKCGASFDPKPRQCTECRRATYRKYYLKNKDKLRNANAKWRLDNSVTLAASKKAYYEEHIERIKERDKEYRTNNPAKVAASKRKYYNDNREHVIAKTRKYVEEHKDQTAGRLYRYRQINKDLINKKWRQYREDNVEKIRESNRARYVARSESERSKAREYRRTHTTRLSRRDVIGRHTNQEVEELFIKQKGRCATKTCKVKLLRSGKGRFHKDHVSPLSRGGSNDIANISLLCPRCNQCKNAKPPEKWAREVGVLFV